MRRDIKYALIGVAALLVVKYAIVGLDHWNAILHPGRVEPDTLNRFDKPLLGLFG